MDLCEACGKRTTLDRHHLARRKKLRSSLDDREGRPGSKFADADLIGIPIRINVGERGLQHGQFELKSRRAADVQMIAVDEVIESVRRVLAQ